jgi:signal transduction histidine kinase/DNA-binding response OmpR family regulator
MNDSRPDSASKLASLTPSRGGFRESVDARLTPAIYTAIVVSMLLVLIADFYTPLGITVWVVYIVPVGFSLWLWRPLAPVIVAIISTILMLVAFLTDAEGYLSRELALMNRCFGILTIWVLAIAGQFFIKNRIAVRYQAWARTGQMKLSKSMGGDPRLEQLGDAVLEFFADYLGCAVGACYAKSDGVFRRIATYGVPSGSETPKEFTLSDGLLGQCVKDNRCFTIHDVPDGYLTFGSAFGQSKPRHLILAPVQSDGNPNAVIELGFMNPIDESVHDMLDRLSESIGTAIRSANDRSNLQNLLEETQRQAEELQTQSEELRVTNEELEEQSRALSESQARLEVQHLALEETNLQLSDQAKRLEAQRDDLSRAQAALQQKAQELEMASQYKSDFLANMSHELRTPLNSSLILAKLLADNPQENLTSEQVRYAETILAAGNDLLTLINDILDLSKIEAGRMEVRAESVTLARFISNLDRAMRPAAEQKRLQFVSSIDTDCVETIHTDAQRLEQILKNLLSNAIKFTESGNVTLRVFQTEERQICFAVTDTGIGISADQQDLVFDAFRQLDSASHRKFGGTGLGLSISRELARLLGGDITLTSEEGQGSTFAVTIPQTFYSQSILPTARLQTLKDAIPEKPLRLRNTYKPTLAPKPELSIEDDRSELRGDRRTILVVEDDEAFARILYDLAHELDFQCLIANCAEAALAMAVQYLPSAVVLDLGLPDHSGLSVLDRLKQDTRTRHIPVHVVSASDYSQTAMAMGAVGYMLKPVKRDELMEAMKSLETRLAQRMRNVIVVEDDPVQLSSLQTLLNSHDVRTAGAANVAECLEQLKSTTFDCMVLDLSLPDSSGFSLLETLSREDTYAFPPVIVYTGRDLSVDEEQLLRRYSKSIIIKGAKSPERLLDEVTLFLHQVVNELPQEQQKMIERSRNRDAVLEGRRILIVEDDIRNIFALTSILEPRGAVIQIARNGQEAVDAVERSGEGENASIDLVLMDVMMPVMDGLNATRTIRKIPQRERLPIIMLTAKAMKDDQANCIAAGANDYMAKPLDVEQLLSLVRVWMPR